MSAQCAEQVLLLSFRWCVSDAGGWYDPVLASADCPYVMSPAGSPPAMVEGFMQNFAGR